jgi:hypothetical protein
LFHHEEINAKTLRRKEKGDREIQRYRGDRGIRDRNRRKGKTSKEGRNAGENKESIARQSGADS